MQRHPPRSFSQRNPLSSGICCSNPPRFHPREGPPALGCPQGGGGRAFPSCRCPHPICASQPFPRFLGKTQRIFWIFFRRIRCLSIVCQAAVGVWQGLMFKELVEGYF